MTRMNNPPTVGRWLVNSFTRWFLFALIAAAVVFFAPDGPAGLAIERAWVWGCRVVSTMLLTWDVSTFLAFRTAAIVRGQLEGDLFDLEGQIKELKYAVREQQRPPFASGAPTGRWPSSACPPCPPKPGEPLSKTYPSPQAWGVGSLHRLDTIPIEVRRLEVAPDDRHAHRYAASVVGPNPPVVATWFTALGALGKLVLEHAGEFRIHVKDEHGAVVTDAADVIQL